MKHTEDRKQREKIFHNKSFSNHTRSGLSNFYRLSKFRENFYRNLIGNDCRGKRVLEYGCGPGSQSFFLAKNGARVVGIDISEVAIARAEKTALTENLTGRTEFLLMDAENLDFDDSYFDLVCGTAIIHHLDVDAAFSEVSRVLKPGGRAVFIEPLGYNFLINSFRKLTPKLRTPDEHPLKSADFKIAKNYFKTVNSYHFDLCTLLALPFVGDTFFDSLVNMLRRVDNFIFGLPLVKWFSWAVVLELSEPKKLYPRGNINHHAAPN